MVGGYRITGMSPSHSRNGYWLASANGDVEPFGDAAPYGNVLGMNLNAPVVGMATTTDGAGYWLQARTAGSSRSVTHRSWAPWVAGI